MKKTIFRILTIVIIIIASFIVPFIIGLQIEDNPKEIEEKQENEKSKKDNTQTSTTNSLENIFTNSDIDATKRNSFEGRIVEVDIDKKQIHVENPTHLVHNEMYHADYEWYKNHQVIIDEVIYVKAGYLLCVDNVPIKDYNGNKIEICDLKVGDTINVEYVAKIIFETLTSDNIILIERKSEK